MTMLIDIKNLAEMGGTIIWVLLIVAVILWMFLFERIIFMRMNYPRFYRQSVAEWQGRKEHSSWAAEKIREAILSENDMQLSAWLSTIKMLTAICPLLGLLGTVSGMLDVFDTIAITGTSDAKAMADGIYRATLTTMAGIVVALSALYFIHYLTQQKKRWLSNLSYQLTLQKDLLL